MQITPRAIHRRGRHAPGGSLTGAATLPKLDFAKLTKNVLWRGSALLNAALQVIRSPQIAHLFLNGHGSYAQVFTARWFERSRGLALRAGAGINYVVGGI